MRREVRAGFEAGATNLSFGLVYFPGAHADTDELVAVAEVAAEFGAPLVPHVRNEGAGLLAAIDEMLEVSRRSGAALHVSHLKSLADEALIEPLLERLEERRRRHLRPVPLRRRLHPAREPPAGVGAGGRRGRDARTPARSGRGRAGWRTTSSTGSPAGRTCSARSAPSGSSSHGDQHRRPRRRPSRDGRELLARDRARRPDDPALRLRRAVRRIAAHPLMLLGSDGIFGEHPHPRVAGSAARFLGRFCLRDGLLEPEEAIARLTARAADRFGLSDRGRIEVGQRADLVLLDPAAYVDRQRTKSHCGSPTAWRASGSRASAPGPTARPRERGREASSGETRRDALDRGRAGPRAGRDMLPLHGTVAAPLPPHVREAVAAALDEHAVTPPSRGDAGLREAIARSLPAPADPERELLVTNGAMHALSLVFRAVPDTGDAVIVPTPGYFFQGLIERAGGVFVPVATSPQDGWRWDPEAIEHAVTPRSRVLVLTTRTTRPGTCRAAELDELLGLASRHGLKVITDEAYERCIHEGELASAWGGDDVILVRSLGKSLAMPAWRVGFVAGAPPVVDACLDELEWDVIRVSHVAQRAATAALEGPQDWLDEVVAGYRRDRDAAHAAVAEHPVLSASLPAATPFLWLDLGDLSSDDLLAAGVAVVDGAAFGTPGYARLPFAGADERQDALRQHL